MDIAGEGNFELVFLSCWRLRLVVMQRIVRLNLTVSFKDKGPYLERDCFCFQEANGYDLGQPYLRSQLLM